MTIDSTDQRVPAGFEPLPTGLGFNDMLQPSYRRVDGESVSVGLVVQERHGNSMGICHGGVIMTLSDMTAALGVNAARGEIAGSPTISLSIDFVSAARIGEWIQADAEQVDLKRRFGFCSGLVRGDKGVVARFNGTFYFPDHQGMWKNGRSSESLWDKRDDDSAPA